MGAIDFWKKLTGGSPNSASKGKRRFRFTWVLPGQLALGSLPVAATDYTHLEKEGIQAILSLCPEAEGSILSEFADRFECLRYPLPDSHYQQPLQVEDVAGAVAVVNGEIAGGKALYLHCFAGIERSPTICIAYLCRHQKLEVWEALRCLKQVHPRTAPTQTELQVVQAYLDRGQ